MVTESPNSPEKVRSILLASSETLASAADSIAPAVAEAASLVVDALRGGSKVLLCGNGGSAADAQHIAAELAGRLRRDRAGLPAVALTVNPSVLTALSNDYGYDEVFARQIEALGRKGDVLIGISTSGSSENVVRALKAGRAGGLRTIGLLGETGGAMEQHCDLSIRAPESDTPRIQEVHITVGHAICEIVEDALFGG
jgi:D-sedoheptulose 7-phosphate isomerase